MYIINWFPFWRNTFGRDGWDLRKQEEVRGYATENKQEEYFSWVGISHWVGWYVPNKGLYFLLNWVKIKIVWLMLISVVMRQLSNVWLTAR